MVNGCQDGGERCLIVTGVYTCLFLEASYIMLQKRRENITSARVSYLIH